MKENNRLVKKVLKDLSIRKELARENHYWFMNIYLSRYITYPTALFQKEMFEITENDDIRMAVIVAFRGSAKSTIMTLSCPIWAIIGKPQKKFILILCQTQSQAKLHLSNIKAELESNELLAHELGPFIEQNEEWSAGSIVMPKYGARITVASTEQSIRGLRHRSYRPDLIICDDIEDLSSVKTREGRDKTYNWLVGEVIPAGDKNTKIMIIGNLLHEDSVLMRLKEAIKEKRLNGVFKFYPLVDQNEKILWTGKYSDMKAIEAEKQKTGDRFSWEREYMLRILPSDEQIIHKEQLKYYDSLPEINENCRLIDTCIGVDLAISEKDTADFTAIVCAKIYYIDNKLKVFILPLIVNERLGFTETVNRIKEIPNLITDKIRLGIYIEKVGYQESLVQQLKSEGVSAEGVELHGEDKRARLTRISMEIVNGLILFPKQGTEKLIEQILGFGVEKHDDLVDAFTLLILRIIAAHQKEYHPYNWGSREDRVKPFFSRYMDF